MKRRSFFALPFSSFAAPCGLAWEPDEAAENQYAKTVSWYKAMFRPLEELAAVIDRLRLLGSLRDLEKVCDDMISDKSEIVSLLDRKPPLRDDLSEILNRLRTNVKLTRTRVGRVRSALREEFNTKGAGVADELSDDLAARKSWVLELSSRVRSASDEELASYSKKAAASKEALKAANAKLAELVRFLDRQQ